MRAAPAGEIDVSWKLRDSSVTMFTENLIEEQTHDKSED